MKYNTSLSDIFKKYLIEQNNLDNELLNDLNQENDENNEDDLENIDQEDNDQEELDPDQQMLINMRAELEKARREASLPMKEKKSRYKERERSRLSYGESYQQDPLGHVNYLLDDDGRFLRYRGYTISKRRLPKKLSKTDLIVTQKRKDNKIELQQKSLQNLKSYNRETKKMEEGVVISYETLDMGGQFEVLMFKNYGNVGAAPDLKIDENGPYRYNFIILKDYGNRGQFYIDIPQSRDAGVIKMSPEEFDSSGNRTPEDARKYARELISRAINSVFKNQTAINELNEKFIAEPVGDYRHTEMSSNVLKYMEWGVAKPTINVQFNSVIGSENMERVLNNLKEKMNDLGVNVDFFTEENKDMLLDIFGVDDEVDNDGVPLSFYTEEGLKQYRRKNGATYMRRKYAGYIYTKGGEWKHEQRVGSPELYRDEGGPTPIKGLDPKDIKGGRLLASSMSTLNIHGELNNRVYTVNINFLTDFAFRLKGEKSGSSYGPIINPIQINLSERLPDNLKSDDIRLDKAINRDGVKFLVGENGIITRALQQLYETIKKYDDDKIIQKIAEVLSKEQPEENQRGIEINEIKKPKIKLTESQLIRLRKNLLVENLSDIESTSVNNVEVPHKNVVTLLNIGRDWCRTKSNIPECIEIMKLREKLNIV